jgi:hypothetical protein
MNLMQGKQIKKQLTTVTLIYINMPVDWRHCRQGTAS